MKKITLVLGAIALVLVLGIPFLGPVDIARGEGGYCGEAASICTTESLHAYTNCRIAGGSQDSCWASSQIIYNVCYGEMSELLCPVY